ncbi:MAG TPA: segregation/condensation protein A [Acidimicrobiales bacterium]|nr:segregation/condensation protein A [Acidimicrobiales bacterium]
MSYEVQTPVFEGPFDLLLHLIVREQVDLYEIPLARIVDAYLVELDRISQDTTTLDLDVATEFLLIAATLVELKARRLLPGLDDGDLDEELALWEERDLLLARLLECKTFKDAARALAGLADVAGRSFPRRAGLEERYHSLAPDLLLGVTPADLKAAFLRAVAPKPVPTVDISHLHISAASVGDAVAELMDELPRTGPITFRRLTAELVDRLEVVVRFLALLELFKQGYVDLEQADAFGDITVAWVGGGELDGPAIDLALVGIDVYEG